MPALITGTMTPTNALLIVLILVLVSRACQGYMIRCSERYGRRERMVVSPKARKVTQEAQQVFNENGGKPTYRTYRRKVTDADPVQFTRVRELFQSDSLTPERVQGVL